MARLAAMVSLSLLLTLSTAGRALGEEGWRETCAQCGDGSLPALLLALTGDDLSARLDAIEAMGRYPSPLATEPLLHLLKHETPALRRAAATALGHRAEPRAGAALVQTTGDRYQSVRLAALQALGAYPTFASRTCLTEVLVSQATDVSLRRAALVALVQHGTHEAKRALKEILAKLKSANTDPLAQELADAAAKLTPCPTCVEPQRTLVLTELLRPEPAHRLWAVHTLATLDVPAADKTRLLGQSLADPSPDVRDRALEKVGTLAETHEEAAKLLVAVALGEKATDDSLREQAAKRLTNATGVRATALVAATREHALTPVNEARLVGLLGSARGEHVVPALAGLATRASTERTRDAALAALGARDDSAGRAALADLAAAETDSLATQAALVALRSGIEVSPARLAALLVARPTVNPAPVLAALRKRKPQDGYTPWKPVFEVLLRHPQADVREEALRLLLAAPAPSGAEVFEVVSAALLAAPDAEAVRRYYGYLASWGPSGLDELQRRLLADTGAPADVRAHALGDLVSRHPDEAPQLLAHHRHDAHREVSLLSRGLATRPTSDAQRAPASGMRRVPPGPDALYGGSPLLLPDTPLNGRWPLVLSMSALGATAFGNVAALAEATAGTRTLAFTLGGLIGGATPYLLTRDVDITLGQSAYLTTHTTWAAMAAWRGAHLLRFGERLELPGSNRGLGILGGMAGVAIAGARTRSSTWSGADALRVNVGGLQAALAFRVLAPVWDQGSASTTEGTRRLNSGAALVGYGVGILPTAWALSHLQLGPGDPGLIALGMGTGAWLSAWASLGAPGDGTLQSRVWAGALGGQAVGYLVGTFAAAGVEVAPMRSARLAASGLLGAAVSSGIALAARPPREPNLGGFGLTVDAGALAGLALAATLPQALTIDRGRENVLMLGAVYGAAAGGFFALGDPQYERVGHGPQRHFGGALAGASLGLLGGALLAPKLSPTADTIRAGLGVTTMLGTGAAGLGLWTCRLADASAACDARGRAVRFGEIGAGLGVMTGLVLADRLPTTRASASNGAAGALWGAWHGALLAELDSRATATSASGEATAIGAAAGMGLYLATGALHLDGALGWAALGGTLGGNAYGAGLSYLWPERSARERVTLTLAAPYALGALGLLAAPLYDAAPRPSAQRLMLAAGLGAWHGALIPDVWRPRAAHRSERRLGGATVGGLTGLLLATATVPVITDMDVVETTIAASLGNVLGYGLGQMDTSAGSALQSRYLLGAGLGLALAGAVTAPVMTYDGRDVPLFALATGLGAASGWVVAGAGHQWPLLDDGRRTDTEWRMRSGSAVVGATSALVLGAVASQHWELAPSDAFELAYAHGAGNALGYGLGGLIDPSQSKLRAQTQLGGAALATLGAALLYDKTTYSPTDFGLGALALGIGTWHGQLGRTRVPEADDAKPTLTVGRARYASVLAAGLGSLGAMGLAQVVDYGWGDLGEVAASSVLGNTLGLGVSLMLPQRNTERRVLAQHIAGLGLAGAALVAAPLTHYEAADSSTFVLASSLGAAFGSWAPSLWHERPISRERSGGLLTGASTGVLAAAVASQWLGVTPKEGGGIALGLGTLAALGDGAAHLVFDDARSTSRARIALGSSLGFGAAAAVASPWLTRAATERPVLMAVGGAWGAAQFIWVSDLIEGERTRRRRLASLELGVPLGAATMGVLLHGLDFSTADGAELLAGVALGQVAGHSLARLGDSDSRARARGAALGGVGGTVLGLVLAPHLSFQPADLLYAGASAGLGATYGWQLGSDLDAPGDVGTWLGFSAGALVGGLAAPVLKLSPSDTLESSALAGLAHLFVDRTGSLMHSKPTTRRLSTSLAGLGGFVAGSFLTPSTHYHDSDYGLMSLSTGLGAVTGLHVARLLESEIGGGNASQDDGLALGGSLGLVVGATLAQSLQLQPGVIAQAAVGGVIGNALGWGVGQLANPDERTAATAIGMGAGGLSLAVTGGLFGDRLSLSGGNAGMVGLLAVTGAWHGAWLSRTWNNAPVDDATRRQLGGGALLGTGIGVLTGAAFSRALAYGTADVAESALAWSAASGFGAGVGLLASEDDRVAVSLMQGFGVIGSLAMARYAPSTEFGAEDWLLGALATGHGVWQGIGTAKLLELDARKLRGGLMATTAAGGVLGALLSQRLNISMSETLAGFSGTLWGTWLGAWIGYVYRDSLGVDRLDGIAGVSLIGSDVGLALSALAVSPIGDMAPARVGWINLFGAAGALAGAAVGTMIPLDDNVQRGTVFGTAAGLAAGVFGTSLLHLGTREQEPVDSTDSASSGRSGLVPHFTQVVPTMAPTLDTDPYAPPLDVSFFFGLVGQWI